MDTKVWQQVALGLLLPLLVFGVGSTATLRGATAQSADATITMDATRPGDLIQAGLWGSNLTIEAPAAETVEHPTFVDASRQIGVTVIRWPGGNQASAYDWKTNEMIKPGRRKLMDDRVDMARILQFVRDIGAELSITVNFGTMSAQDAADLVEFLNGPADSTWGAQRADLGFREPINVRYFEIGNEENQPHMWYYSWTAENPYKYFFGGAEERRGFYDNISSQDYDPVGAKGDFFKASGGPNQTYTLRFPPVRDVQVYGFSDRAAAESCLQTYRQAGSIPLIPGQCEAWREVAELSTQPPDAKVFTLDAQAGLLRFGDGVHGAMPPADSYFLVEYTTYGHDGFLDFARAMRSAPSSVPIQIGAAVLPFTHGDPITESVATMREIFGQMDFYVRHQYDSGIPTRAYGVYNHRRQIASDRLEMAVYRRVSQYVESIGLTEPPAIGTTEWNVFLNQDYWHINRTLEGGVIAAEWFIRLLNAGETAPVAYAEQFALHGSNLALIRSQTNYSIAPMGYVFQGFADWPGGRVISPTVTSPAAMAYDKIVPYVVATAALSSDGRTLRIAVVNNAEDTPLTAALQITGFTATSARLWRLSADRYDADNDRDPTNVVLVEEPVQVPLTEIRLPAHSVTFVELQGTSQAAYVDDANANGVGDEVDIQATAAEVNCRVYLPLVVANWYRPWPTPSTFPYPRLHANLFNRVPEDEAVYNLSNPGRSPLSQVTVYEAKKRNPNLTTFAHRGLKHIEAQYFGYGTNSPQRWFIDRLSPRWFAYTPLIELEEPVTRTSQITFQFRPEDVQRRQEWGVRVAGYKPWGESADPASPHYADLTREYARNEHIAFWLSRAQVEAHLEESHGLAAGSLRHGQLKSKGVRRLPVIALGAGSVAPPEMDFLRPSF